MSTNDIIFRMKSNVKTSVSNSTKSLYSYEKIAKNSDKLFKNSNLPILIKQSKNFAKDEDLTKIVRTNLRKLLKSYINECNKFAEDKAKFLQSFSKIRDYFNCVTDSTIFSPDSLTNSEDTKLLLTDIFSLSAIYSTAKQSKEKSNNKSSKSAKSSVKSSNEVKAEDKAEDKK